MYLQRTRGEAVFGVFNVAFLIVLSLTFVIPFLSIISTSLIGIEEWARRGAFILFPQSIEFGAYQVLFTGGSRLATGFFYSVARILVGTTLNLFFTATVLPLSTASIATIGLFCAVWHWNEWFYAFLYINDTVKLPLPLVLRNILTAGMIEDTEMIPIDQFPPAQSLKTAMIVVTVTPILSRGIGGIRGPAA